MGFLYLKDLDGTDGLDGFAGDTWNLYQTAWI